MALTFDKEKMEIYPTLQDLETSVFGILNAIANTMQVRLCICSTAHLNENEHTLANFYIKNVFWACFDGCDVDLQRVQTVQSWLAKTMSSFVDAKVDDHILAWAHVTVKTSMCKNLEEPQEHFKNYGEFP